MEFSSPVEVLRLAFFIYLALLLIAALSDAYRFLIPNFVSLALAFLFLGIGIYLGSPWQWWATHLGAGILLLVIGYIAWSLRLFGAGDVKFLAAAGLFVGVGTLHQMLLYVALAGGALVLVLVPLRHALWLLILRFSPDPRTATIPRLFVVGAPVPYGLAIAGGAALAGYPLFLELGIVS